MDILTQYITTESIKHAFVNIFTVPIKVTEFTLKISTSGRRKLHRDLLAEVNFLRVTIHPTKDTLTLTCAGSGKQEPTVQISNYNSGITTEKGRANHVISKAGCKDSGVYRCHIWNSFMSSQVQRIIDVRCKFVFFLELLTVIL